MGEMLTQTAPVSNLVKPAPTPDLASSLFSSAVPGAQFSTLSQPQIPLLPARVSDNYPASQHSLAENLFNTAVPDVEFSSIDEISIPLLPAPQIAGLLPARVPSSTREGDANTLNIEQASTEPETYPKVSDLGLNSDQEEEPVSEILNDLDTLPDRLSDSLDIPNLELLESDNLDVQDLVRFSPSKEIKINVEALENDISQADLFSQIIPITDRSAESVDTNNFGGDYFVDYSEISFLDPEFASHTETVNVAAKQLNYILDLIPGHELITSTAPEQILQNIELLTDTFMAAEINIHSNPAPDQERLQTLQDLRSLSVQKAYEFELETQINQLLPGVSSTQISTLNSKTSSVIEKYTSQPHILITPEIIEFEVIKSCLEILLPEVRFNLSLGQNAKEFPKGTAKLINIFKWALDQFLYNEDSLTPWEIYEQLLDKIWNCTETLPDFAFALMIGNHLLPIIKGDITIEFHEITEHGTVRLRKLTPEEGEITTAHSRDCNQIIVLDPDKVEVKL